MKPKQPATQSDPKKPATKAGGAPRKTARGNWLTTIPLVAVGVAWLYFWFLPQGREIEQLRRQLDSQRSLAGQIGTVRAQVETTGRQVEETGQFVESWRRAAPQNDRIAVLFGQIGQAIRDSGGELTSFHPRPHEPLEHLNRIPLNLAVQGDFASQFALLKRLEALPAIVWLENLTLETGQEDSGVRSEASLVIFSEKTESSD